MSVYVLMVARKKNKSRLGQDERSPSPQSADVVRPPREPKITYIDADKTLEYETDAFSLKFHIADRIPFVLAVSDNGSHDIPNSDLVFSLFFPR